MPSRAGLSAGLSPVLSRFVVEGTRYPCVETSAPVARWVALSGTPGTGKSSVARALEPFIPSVEVGSLALQLGAGRKISGRGVRVDMARLCRAFRRLPAPRRTKLVVGHLAHLLPLRDVILLRCHPGQLEVRLRRARASSAAVAMNLVAEATDSILWEAVRAHRRVWEIDTTQLSVRQVAERIRRGVSRPRSRTVGRVDWLADPKVPEQLLRVAH